MKSPPNVPAVGLQLTEMLRSEFTVAVAEIRGSAEALDTATSARTATVEITPQSFRRARVKSPKPFVDWSPDPGSVGVNSQPRRQRGPVRNGQ
jgi:hypothetical protein